MSQYPNDAFSPSGELWWETEHKPGSNQRFGVSKRLAAWIHFNMEIGSTVTMRVLRSSISNKGNPNTDEHFNRRFRELRESGWKLTSNKEDSSLASDEYRLAAKGASIWIEGARPGRSQISGRIRRQVLERDKQICQVCFIGAGEEYPSEPGSRARMTVGHLRANALDGSVDLLNLRTECARCNETVRDEFSIGEGIDVIWPKVRRLSKSDKTTLLIWLDHGSRPSTEVAMIFDDITSQTSVTKLDLINRLKDAT